MLRTSLPEIGSVREMRIVASVFVVVGT